MRDHRLAGLYDATTWYWDSGFYWWIHRRSYQSLFAALVRRGWLESSSAPLRVVDCGIGTGLLSSALTTTLDQPVELYGVDTSPGMLHRALIRLQSLRARLHLMRADIGRLPFGDRQMDLVMGALVLEHAPAPPAVLREMVRVARPNAPILLIATRRGAPDWPFRICFRYRPYPQEQVVQWMTEAGISKVSLEHLSGLGRLFARAYLGSASPWKGRVIR